jgi:hypothetical protein
MVRRRRPVSDLLDSTTGAYMRKADIPTTSSSNFSRLISPCPVQGPCAWCTGVSWDVASRSHYFCFGGSTSGLHCRTSGCIIDPGSVIWSLYGAIPNLPWSSVRDPKQTLSRRSTQPTEPEATSFWQQQNPAALTHCHPRSPTPCHLLVALMPNLG